MIRFPDWEQRLAAYLEPLRATPFAWGRHDCCTFVCGAVQAMTGIDAMAEFRGQYDSEAASLRALVRIGKGDLASSFDASFAEVPVSFAHRGDIALLDGGKGVALIMGPFAIRPGESAGRSGFVKSPRPEWEHAWRVPMPGSAE